MAEPRGWDRAGRWLAAGLLALLVGFPLVELFSAALAGGLAPLRRAFPGAAVLNTVWTGLAVTVLALAGGTGAALATERAGVPGRRWLRGALLLALLVPPFVTAFGWAQAYGRAGLTDDLLGVWLPWLFGPLGIVVVLAVHALPLAYLVVASGLAARAEPDTERAARASGATRLQALRTVTLPLLRPALTAAAALVFVTSVNAFGIPVVLGTPAGFRTVTTRIYADLVLAADPAAFTRVLALAAGLVLLTTAVVAAADATVGLAGGRTRTAAPAGGTGTLSRSRLPAVALWLYLALTTGLPLLALVLVAATRAVGLAPVPANWTFAHFAEAASGVPAAALGRSLLLALIAATVVVALGGLLAALGPRAWGGGTVAILTFALPGSALAVAVLLAYGPWLRDTVALILVAYLAKFWALGHRPIAGAADRLPPELYRAARASGAGVPVALRTVVLPLLRPAIVGAWSLVFLFALHELTMSSLLYGPGSATLAVVILNLQQLGDVSVTSALAVLLTLLVFAGIAPLMLLRRGSAWLPGGE